MCGIAGSSGDQGDWITRATACLDHRGPDRSTVFRDSGVQLGHARLAVIDLSTDADQPMFSADRQTALIFNGEIYNFHECRTELEARGHRFRTKSDTEVLLRLLELEGASALSRLRGMFAIAFWDARRQQLLLARDRMGEKPLYYTQLRDGHLLFASEIKALLAHPAVSPELDPVALDEYLTYLYVPAPRTMFRGISALEPGATLTWHAGACSHGRYWSLPACTPFTGDRRELEDEVLARLEKSVERTLVADVPLGVFLSGGLDSASIVAIASKFVPRLKTFTVTFGAEGAQYDEREPAAIVARHFGTDHRELHVSGDAVQLLPTVVRHFDQPFGNPTALLTYQLSREARRFVTVALGGDGGDEVFGGYPRYRGIALAEQYARVPAGVRRGLGLLSRALPESTSGRHTLRRAREFLGHSTATLEEQYSAWVGYYDAPLKRELYTEPLRRIIGDADAGAFLRTLIGEPGMPIIDRAVRCDLASFLPFNVLEYGDKMSMAHGLEVRLPYLDADLVALMASLPASVKMPGGDPKHLLKAVMAPHLPPAILARRKMGFNPPMGRWIDQLKDRLDDYLGERQLRARGYFRPEIVRRMREDHRTHRRDYSLHLWALVMLEEWHRQYID